MNAVLSAKDDMIPSHASIFAQKATAAPSGPHVSGTTRQASDWIPRSAHWLSLNSNFMAFLTWKKKKTHLDLEMVMILTKIEFSPSFSQRAINHKSGISGILILEKWSSVLCTYYFTSGCSIRRLSRIIRLNLLRQFQIKNWGFWGMRFWGLRLSIVPPFRR